MLKFSFPHLYYNDLISITTRNGEDPETPAINLTRGERYKSYQVTSTTTYNDIRFNFSSIHEIDHCIVSRADLAEDLGNLNYIRILAGASSSTNMPAPLVYSDLYNQDIILIRNNPASPTNIQYSIRTSYSTSVSRFWMFSKVQFSIFFQFDYNPSEWGCTTKSNQARFKTDLDTEISVEIDYPKRVFTGTWEAISDSQLATFKTYVQQQMTDNQYAYCYLYDDSGLDQLMGSALTHVKITKFDYMKDSKKDGTPYNIINLEMEEVRG